MCVLWSDTLLTFSFWLFFYFFFVPNSPPYYFYRATHVPHTYPLLMDAPFLCPIFLTFRTNFILYHGLPLRDSSLVVFWYRSSHYLFL